MKRGLRTLLAAALVATAAPPASAQAQDAPPTDATAPQAPPAQSPPPAQGETPSTPPAAAPAAPPTYGPAPGYTPPPGYAPPPGYPPPTYQQQPWAAPQPYPITSADQSGADGRRREAASDYRHDGFYLRLGVGGGLLQTSSQFEGNVGSLPASEAIGTITYSGAAVALDFVIGAALVPGFVLAYGFAGQIVGEPNVNVQDSAGGDYEENSTSSLGLSIHGIAVDIFPNPTQNLELGGLLGLASIGTGPQDTSSLGWGAALWGGYGLWLNRGISMAALLRLGYARTASDDYVPVTTNLPSGRSSNIDRSDETLTLALLAEFLVN